MPNLWNANTDAQYVLNAYVATSYCSSYMTKVDKSMTNAFRRIHKEHEKSEIDAMQMICTLGNTLLNLQQMSAQQASSYSTFSSTEFLFKTMYIYKHISNRSTHIYP
jgi:hypothetical protein